MVAALILTSSHYQIPWYIRIGFANIVCSSSSLENDATCDVSINSDFFANGIFSECFHYFSWIGFFFTISSACFIDRQLHLCALGYAVHIFHTTDAKYIMFHVG